MPAKQIVEVDGRELGFSNAEKILYPTTGYTKGQVIASTPKLLIPFYRTCKDGRLR